MNSPIVTLNVGGTHFTTTQDTLHKEPSSKLSLTVRGILPSATDDGGHTFLDRDARFFQLILNFLRDGWVLLPDSPSERRELMQEARYYQVRRALCSCDWQNAVYTLARKYRLSRLQSALVRNINEFKRSSMSFLLCTNAQRRTQAATWRLRHTGRLR